MSRLPPRAPLPGVPVPAAAFSLLALLVSRPLIGRGPQFARRPANGWRIGCRSQPLPLKSAHETYDGVRALPEATWKSTLFFSGSGRWEIQRDSMSFDAVEACTDFRSGFEQIRIDISR